MAACNSSWKAIQSRDQVQVFKRCSFRLSSTGKIWVYTINRGLNTFKKKRGGEHNFKRTNTNANYQSNSSIQLSDKKSFEAHWKFIKRISTRVEESNQITSHSTQAYKISSSQLCVAVKKIKLVAVTAICVKLWRNQISCSNSNLCDAVKKLEVTAVASWVLVKKLLAEGVQQSRVHCTLCFSERLLVIGEEST